VFKLLLLLLLLGSQWLDDPALATTITATPLVGFRSTFRLRKAVDDLNVQLGDEIEGNFRDFTADGKNRRERVLLLVV
jgi:hypothetical protein